ncbi:hypothetical protein [Chryseobacterium sp. CP-77]|uniref:hypothetical protein n=1 Tax=Chryseobacterium sp. CP-77 TaxID=3116594 RepID=UPI002ED490F8
MKKLIFFYFLFISNLYFSQNYMTLTTKDIQEKFEYKYKKDILSKFIASMKDIDHNPLVSESIPGKVIRWDSNIGQYSIIKNFLVSKNDLEEIKTNPNDKEFLTNLNNYFPKESQFTYSDWGNGTIIKILSDGNFLIANKARSYHRQSMIPNNDIITIELEYKTKNFKEFKLVRFKKINDKIWTVVK